MAIKFKRSKDTDTATGANNENPDMSEHLKLDTTKLNKEEGVDSRVKSTHRLSSFNKLIDSAKSSWATLSSRDQFALLVLGLFLIVVMGGYGGYLFHTNAVEKKANYQSHINDYFMLRGQAANIQPNAQATSDGSIEQQLTDLLNQSGVSDAQVLASEDAVQISFNHPSQSVASNVMGAIINAGMSVSQLSMDQNSEDKSVQVQATIDQ